MKVVIEKEELVKATQIAQTGISTKSTLPHLNSFFLEARDKEILISATDLEIAVKCTVPCNVKKKGKVTVIGKKFAEIVKELPGEEVAIEEIEENRILIKSGTDVFRLSGIPVEDFPEIPEFDEKKGMKVEKEKFQNMLIKTHFSSSTDESRYVLCGVYCVFEKGKLKVVATDGRRLSYIYEETNKSNKGNVIIPNKTVNTLLKLLNFSKGEELLFGITENMVAFKFDSILLTSRIIDGSFPNYEQVIPKSQECSVTCNVQELLKATRRVSLMTTERSRAVKYDFKKNTLLIYAQTEGIGEGVTEIPVNYENKEIEIAFNPQFIIDTLRHIDTDEVEIMFTNSLNPVTFKPKGKDNYLNIIMPMRV